MAELTQTTVADKSMCACYVVMWIVRLGWCIFLSCPRPVIYSIHISAMYFAEGCGGLDSVWAMTVRLWEARHRSPVNHKADSNDRWVILHLQALRVVCQSLEKMYCRLREKMGTLGEHFKHIWHTRKPKTNYQICTFFAGFELKWKTTLLNFMDQRVWHITAVDHGPWKTIGWSSQCTGFVLMLTPEEILNF